MKTSKLFATLASTFAAVLVPCTTLADASTPAPGASSVPAVAPAAASPFIIPVGKQVGYRVEISQTFGAEWYFTGSLVFSADPTGKLTGGYLGDTDQQNPSYPTDPMLGRMNPVSGTITPDNKINLQIGSGSLLWTVAGKVTPGHINGTMSSGRFGLMTFYASRVHIPPHPANMQESQ
jgi:hypothetical protein